MSASWNAALTGWDGTHGLSVRCRTAMYRRCNIQYPAVQLTNDVN